MTKVHRDESQLEAAAGVAGPHMTEVFELLSNERRLAILLALWEAYDPHDADDTVTFSELYDRIGVRDSGNFTYHLNKLVGHFVEETDDGYRLRNTGLKIVQATIAGAGLEENALPPTEGTILVVAVDFKHCQLNLLVRKLTPKRYRLTAIRPLLDGLILRLLLNEKSYHSSL